MYLGRALFLPLVDVVSFRSQEYWKLIRFNLFLNLEQRARLDTLLRRFFFFITAVRELSRVICMVMSECVLVRIRASCSSTRYLFSLLFLLLILYFLRERSQTCVTLQLQLRRSEQANNIKHKWRLSHVVMLFIYISSFYFFLGFSREKRERNVYETKGRVEFSF